MELNFCLANMRMTKILGDTSDVVKQINGLMNVKEMTNTMKDIQKSMMQVRIHFCINTLTVI